MKPSQITKYKHSENLIVRLTVRSIVLIYLSFKFLFNNKYRAEIFYHTRYSKLAHQTSSYTKSNRYPTLFNICKDFFEGKEKLKILSFGCSTGEEVATLNAYFPTAKLVGTDINKRCIKIANQKNKTANRSFFHSLSTEYSYEQNFDLIFCGAVFQDHKNRYNKNNEITKYTFEQFESTLEMIDQKLKVGGLIVIDHSDFKFTDSTLFKIYKILEVENNLIKRKRPVYNYKNQKISDTSENYRVFQKLSINKN